VYDFDGANWTQTGNDLNIPGVGQSSLGALSASRVAFNDTSIDELTAYDFDGSDWAQVGSETALAAPEGNVIGSLSYLVI
jgi:hypothetical protein